MSKTQELKERTEEILRNQFVDRAYSKSGKTTWGVDKTRDELITLFTQHADDIRKAALEGKIFNEVTVNKKINVPQEIIDQIRKEAVEGHKHTCSRCNDEFWTAHYLDTDKSLCNPCYEGLKQVETVEEYRAYLKQQESNEKPLCHDCGVKVGKLHKDGCDVEECPQCNHQLISCDCTGSILFKGIKRIPYGEETRANFAKQ